LAQSFLQADLVDKILLFVAPRIAGSGPSFAPELPKPVDVRRLAVEQLGDDLLLSGYVHEP
jgi:riboflavin biosynthesis pyrimidine reductase